MYGPEFDHVEFNTRRGVLRSLGRVMLVLLVGGALVGVLLWARPVGAFQGNPNLYAKSFSTGVASGAWSTGGKAFWAELGGAAFAGTNWVKSRVPCGTLAGIIAPFAAEMLASGVPGWVDFLRRQGWQGEWPNMTRNAMPSTGCSSYSCADGTMTATYQYTLYNTIDEARVASGMQSPTGYPCRITAPECCGWSDVFWFFQKIVTTSSNAYTVYRYVWWPGTGAQVVPVTADDLRQALQTAMQNNDENTRKIIDAMFDALAPNFRSAQHNEPQVPPGYSDPVIRATNDALVDGTTPEDQDQTQEDGFNNEDDSTGGNPDASLSEAMEKALKDQDARDQAGFGDLPPVDLEPPSEEPEKRSLRLVLDAFWARLQALPVISLFSGVRVVEEAGNPRVSFDVGMFGVQNRQEVDFSGTWMGVNYGWILGALGQISLAAAGIYWFLYLFRSGGE